jgi:hypothetical protein
MQCKCSARAESSGGAAGTVAGSGVQEKKKLLVHMQGSGGGVFVGNTWVVYRQWFCSMDISRLWRKRVSYNRTRFDLIRALESYCSKRYVYGLIIHRAGRDWLATVHLWILDISGVFGHGILVTWHTDEI